MNEKEIVDKLNSYNKSHRITDDSFIIISHDLKGVAIKVTNDVYIKEEFNNAFIETLDVTIDKEVSKVICLYTKEEIVPEIFGTLAYSFLKLENRQIICDSPLNWYNEWKALLGNSTKEKMVYDFIGEMAVLLKLQQNGLSPKWDSINKGTFDISTNDSLYEVKTSKLKTSEIVTIHNQFQLNTKGLNKTLYLTYVKVEDNDAGESIDSLFNKLVDAGFDKQILSDYLDQNGYYAGKEERYKQFIIHETRLYPVDEKFPFITQNSFVNNKIPNNVIKFEYTISLDGLNYKLL